jgi:DNA-binding transcriptional regulator LsrR (DeoR family)
MLNDYDKADEEEKRELLAKVSHMYYNEGKTQTEIADYFSSTRFKVSKWLQDARNENIVEITIHNSNNRNTKLENIFKQNFPLTNVIILENQYMPFTDTLRQLGKLGAEYINKIVTPNSTIGVFWGKTLYNVINEIKPEQFLPITAVQMAGSVAKDNPNVDSQELVKTLAAAYNGKYKFLFAPLYVQDDYIRDKIVNEPVIKDTLDYGKKADIILTGIGGEKCICLYNSTWEMYNKHNILDSTVGSILGRIIDKDGNICDIDINRKLIGVDLQSILKAKHRICVVVGKHKAEAVIAAMKGKLINVLVTDRDTAIHILKKSNIASE